MRAQLIELTPDRRTRSRKAWWLNIAFTSAWQSSKVPSMASAWTLLSGAVVIMRRCTSEMRPCGNSTTTSTWLRPRNASTAAPPVSPEVATTMVVRSPRCAQHVVHQPRHQLHGEILEGERRAVKQLQHEQAAAELRQRRDGRMTEGAVGLARHAGEIGVRQTVADERPDHLAGDLGVRLAGEARDRLGRRATARSRARKGRRRGRARPA